MDSYKITTDETLRETIRHTTLKISGSLTFTALTGTGIMN